MKVAVEGVLGRPKSDQVIPLLIVHHFVETEIVRVMHQKAATLSGNQVAALFADPELPGPVSHSLFGGSRARIGAHYATGDACPISRGRARVLQTPGVD